MNKPVDPAQLTFAAPAPDEDEDEPRRFCSDDPDFLVAMQPATRVYINTFDQVVIHQRDDGGDETRIYVSSEYLGILIGRLEALKARLWTKR